MKSDGNPFANLIGTKRRLGFTLIEILVVLTIIGILMALVLGIAGPAQQQARVWRAKGEIAGIEGALGRFETDNGFVPNCTYIGTNASGVIYDGNPSLPGAANGYDQSGRILFLAITGRHWFMATDNLGVNYYTTLKSGQTTYSPNSANASKPNGTNNASANYDTYTNTSAPDGDALRDPWGNSYGYYYNAADLTNHSLFNQVTYDLWSTSGEYSNAPATSPTVKRWTANWPNQ